MTDQPKKKLIEVGLPLDAINKASGAEKSVRHGPPIDDAPVVGASAARGVPWPCCSRSS